MVAEAVNADGIEATVDAVRRQIHLAREARSARQREARTVKLQRLGEQLDAELGALEETLIGKRDWLDDHRRDEPPHPKWKTRWEGFFATEVRLHVLAWETLERAAFAVAGVF